MAPRDTGPAPQRRGGPTLAPTPTGTSRREVYDSANTTNQRVTLVRYEGSPETKDVDVINAYDNAGIVRAFFRKVLNRALDRRAGASTSCSTCTSVRRTTTRSGTATR